MELSAICRIYLRKSSIGANGSQIKAVWKLEKKSIRSYETGNWKQ